MNNVFDQAFSLSQKISDKIIQSGILKIRSPKLSGVNVSQTSGLMLMHSYGSLFPEAASFILFDCPRASKRVPVELFDFTEDGEIDSKLVKIDDPNYKYLLTANLLAATRFASRCMADDAIIGIVTTPDVYLVARGAFEHYLGSDKFLGELVYQSRSGGGSDSLYLSVDHETILIFCKNPDRIKRMSLDKSDEELKKYSLEDEFSRYTWDTYIRKQARNYYPVEAPDGSILEYDESGNRISWLWKKETFLEKYASGDIKFENRNGNWRLFYKDRLKDVKILRSISLNATVLKDISDNAPEDMKGGDLLNSKGSAEIKSFNGNKPDYLKPSSYYQFLIKILNPNNGAVLIPYPEYGGSVQGVGTGMPIQINSKSEYVDLIKWRSKAIGLEINLDSNEAFDITSFFDSQDSVNIKLISQLATIKYNITGEWHEFTTADFSALYSLDEGNLVIVLDSIKFSNAGVVSDALNDLTKINDAIKLAVFSRYDQSLIEPLFKNSNKIDGALYYRVPQVFL